MIVAGKKKHLITDWLICTLSVVPIYSKPQEAAPMVSQILFGETAKVELRKNKQWAKITTTFSKKTAWVDLRQLKYITADQFKEYNDDYAVALDICQVLINDDLSFPVMIGSSLPQYDGLLFKTPDAKYVYNGQAAQFNEVNFSPEMIEKIARRFINAPYFQNGRSIFGMDQAGLIQLIFKCAGISFVEDIQTAYLNTSQPIDFIDLAQAGDVAYFVNKTDQVEHVGIILSDNEILHMVEKARIDKIDHEGIFNVETKKYTYKLKLISRLIPTASTLPNQQ